MIEWEVTEQEGRKVDIVCNGEISAHLGTDDQSHWETPEETCTTCLRIVIPKDRETEPFICQFPSPTD